MKYSNKKYENNFLKKDTINDYLLKEYKDNVSSESDDFEKINEINILEENIK